MLPHITIFNFQVSSYSLCAIAGIAAVVFFNSFRMEKYKISFKELILYYVFGFIFLLIFAKILYVVGIIPEDGLSFKIIWDNLINGGIVFYGGVIGALFGIILCGKILKADIREKLDFFAPCMPLFHVFARMGCALSGCCYGIESTFGIHNHKFPGATLWPFQPVESICNLIIFLGLIIYTKVRSSNKYCLEIYLVTYGICRFVLEFFRGDPVRGVWADGLSTSQHIPILTIIGVMVEIIIIRLNKGGVLPDNPEADLNENQTAIVLSEFDQMRTALLEESGIDLPENPDAVVTEFFHKTFDEGDTVVGGRFAVGDDYVGRMQSAITTVMGDPVQEEESDEFKFYVWSQPTEKENVVNECVLDVNPEGETSIKYHKDLDMNY